MTAAANTLTRGELLSFPREVGLSAEDAERCPLSFAQQGLWFLDQLNPGNIAYNLPQVWRLTGALDIASFQKAVDELVRRQESLRTTFDAVNGRPVQLIAPTGTVSIPVTDLRSQADRDKDVRRIINEEIHRPFNLKTGPLFRVRLLRTADEEHVAIFVLHHIVSDGESFDILRQELGRLYESFRTGNPLTLPELPIQYLDYAAWHRDQLQGELWNDGIQYWKQQLASPLPALELPADHPREAQPNCRGAVQTFHWPDTLINPLRQISRREGVTLFVLLLSALKTFLHRCTGQENIIVGVPMSGRSRTELEGLIGYFINTVVMRTDLSGDPTFTDLLQRVQQTTFGAFEHQEIPFEELVKVACPQHTRHTCPLVQVVLSLQKGYPREWAWGNLRATLVDVESRTAKFDWTFLLEETDCGTRGRLEYNTDLFEATTIESFLRHFQTLLEGIAANPRRRLSELPLLSRAEQEQLLAGPNQTSTDYERNACIQEIFERQVHKSPDSVALIADGRQVTYRQLNEQANRLAHRLRQCGVEPKSLVGICLGRSIEMIVALLATLKAGAAYVPLDRSYPCDRILFMLADTGLSVVVTDSKFESLELPARPITIVCVDDDSESDPEWNTDLPNEVSAGDPAYVMYTSGSTGTPKGAVIPHRAVVRLVRHADYFQVSPADVFLQLAPASFDASTFEIWSALLNGGRLVIFPPHLPSLEELGRTLQEHQVTVLWLTSGLFHQMVDYQLDSLKSVRQLLAGGDVLSVPHVLKALRTLPDCRLINGYGPTENTTFTCCYPVPADFRANRSIPIGKPISNTQVCVLEKNLSPAPIGVPGELYAGGDGLAQGYLNRPELTAAKFVANPYPTWIQSERLYKTGDRVRWLADGNLEFLGRMDRQIKIRGFRVEPGEIEAALTQHPLVRQAAVIISQNNAGDRQIKACVVPASSDENVSDTLRQFLGGKLPAYMIPTHFILVPQLPLTANGKVDYSALPVEEIEAPAANRVATPPRNSTEERLFGIWSAVLGRNDFGVHDNFFQLGGHSLLATRMVSRIAQSFQIELPVRAVFEASTLAVLAETINRFPTDTRRNGIISRRAPQSPARQLLTHLDELSEAEVESLLSASESKQTK